MTEDFLHFVWRTHNFNFHHLKTTDGLPVEILDFGRWNHGAGPDFSFGRIRLDGTEWAGNIEMHLSASEWNRHGHTDDPAYANVVLHVVLEDDGPVFAGARKIPCLALRDRIPPGLLSQYLRLTANSAWVPCASLLPTVPGHTRALWLERMLVERLESKTARIFSILDETRGNWEETFYRSLTSAFGFKVNTAPFERLSRLLHLSVLYKHSDNPMQTEALLFGCAGLLNRIFTDSYAVQLRAEFEHLSGKYGLQAIDAHAWKWGRLRPANFPTIRIAQLAAVIQDFQGLFRKVVEARHADDLTGLFRRPVSDYWLEHSDFDRPARGVSKMIGMDSVRGLLINTVVPFLYCYGKRNDEGLIDRAIDLIASLPGEENGTTRHWSKLNMPNTHAGQSQGLIHLKKAYCDVRRCVECAIGNKILTASQVEL